MKRIAATVIAMALGAGCTLGPVHRRPLLPEPAAWREPVNAGAAVANLPWWELFQDPVLQTHIRTALAENRDLAIAVARIDEARARLGFTRADQYPRFDIEAGARTGEASGQVFPGSDQNDFYDLRGVASFELDLWGKLRRSSEASRAELLGSEWARRTVILTLVTDVAAAYVQLRSFDAQVEIARRTLDSRRTSLDLVRNRFQGGVAPELDVHQAQILESTAAASLAALERAVALTENALSVLLGHNPGPIARGRALDDAWIPPAIPAGLPSELLQRRPDVLVSEQALAAATARVGVAEALRWPSLGLTAAGGWESTEFDDWLDGGSSLWNVAANLLAPVFNAGKNRRRVDVAEAQMRVAALEYEKSVLGAFREVEDALVTVRTTREEEEALRRGAHAAVSASNLAHQRYDGGVTSYLEVLDSERNQFSAELDGADALGRSLVSVIGLYRALGGGWTVEDPATRGYVPPSTASTEGCRVEPARTAARGEERGAPAAEGGLTTPPAQGSVIESEPSRWARRGIPEPGQAPPVE